MCVCACAARTDYCCKCISYCGLQSKSLENTLTSANTVGSGVQMCGLHRTVMRHQCLSVGEMGRVDAHVQADTWPLEQDLSLLTHAPSALRQIRQRSPQGRAEGTGPLEPSRAPGDEAGLLEGWPEPSSRSSPSSLPSLGPGARFSRRSSSFTAWRGARVWSTPL